MREKKQESMKVKRWKYSKYNFLGNISFFFKQRMIQSIKYSIYLIFFSFFWLIYDEM